ncbi:MAG: hypothetical protein D6714_08810, partial [Bacteroidetes bacterium]
KQSRASSGARTSTIFVLAPFRGGFRSNEKAREAFLKKHFNSNDTNALKPNPGYARRCRPDTKTGHFFPKKALQRPKTPRPAPGTLYFEAMFFFFTFIPV